MQSAAEKVKWIPRTRYFGPAKVLEIDDTERRIRLRLTGDCPGTDVWAVSAIAGQSNLRPGDTVLAAGEDLGDLYVIGALNQGAKADGPEKTIALGKGTRAAVEGEPGKQTLKVFSPKRELIFAYDEQNNRARVNMEAGDLEFVTRNGNITFATDREIMFHGRTIGMTGAQGVCIGIMDGLNKLRSSLTLGRKSMQINSPAIGVHAQRGDLAVEEAKYTGKRLSSKVEYFESIAGSVIAKAKNLFQTVEELSQVKAGRMRRMVAETFHFKSKKAFVKAEEDYKIKADKIHLG
jgi:hypothetical protein